MAEPMLEIEGVGVELDGRPILRDVSFTVTLLVFLDDIDSDLIHAGHIDIDIYAGVVMIDVRVELPGIVVVVLLDEFVFASDEFIKLKEDVVFIDIPVRLHSAVELRQAENDGVCVHEVFSCEV